MAGRGKCRKNREREKKRERRGAREQEKREMGGKAQLLLTRLRWENRWIAGGTVARFRGCRRSGLKVFSRKILVYSVLDRVLGKILRISFFYFA